MLKYGYLNSSEMALVKDENSPMFKKAMMRLHRFGHVPMTGNIDTETTKLLNKSRCGVKEYLKEMWENSTCWEVFGGIWRKKGNHEGIHEYMKDISWLVL